jgi:hypothetical protein
MILLTDVFGDLVQLFNQIFLKSNLENDSEIKSIITPNMGISFSSIVEVSLNLTYDP